MPNDPEEIDRKRQGGSVDGESTMPSSNLQNEMKWEIKTCRCVRSYAPIASFRQQQEAWPIVEKRTFKVTTKSWVGHKKPILRKTPDPIGQVPGLLGRMLLQNFCIEMIHI